MLPSLTKLSHDTIATGVDIGPETFIYLEFEYDGIYHTIAQIEAKYVSLHARGSPPPQPLDATRRLGIFMNLCKFLVSRPTAVRPFTLLNKGKDIFETVGFRIESWGKFKREFFYVQWPTRAKMHPPTASPGWQETLPSGSQFVVRVNRLEDWITYEWMALPDDYRALALLQVVYELLPSEAWIGFDKDAAYVCEKEERSAQKECLEKQIDNENPAIAKRLKERLRVVVDKDYLSHNRTILREWIQSAFKWVNPEVWNSANITEKIFETMPGLMTVPRLPVPLYDRSFVNKLYDILQRGAAPDGAQYQRDKEEYKEMDINNFGRENKRVRS